MTLTCALCGDPVTNPENHFRKVEGWEQRREQGGTNALRLREPKDSYAHSWCVDRESRHLNARQGELL